MHSDSDEEREAVDVDDKKGELTFVKILQRHRVLLNKSQTPEVKEKKDKAYSSFSKEWLMLVGSEMKPEKIRKKIQNMKTRVKEKTDLKRTGNKKVLLKEHEKLLLELLEPATNPSVSKIPGAVSSIAVIVEEEASSERDILPPPPSKKRKSPSSVEESEETRNLSFQDLQRMVFIEQLAVLKLKRRKLEKEFNEALD